MASKRLLKKNLNKMMYEVVDECYSIQLYNPSKADGTDKLVDDVVAFRNDIFTKIHSAKSNQDFSAIVKQAEEAQDDYISKLNGLY